MDAEGRALTRRLGAFVFISSLRATRQRRILVIIIISAAARTCAPLRTRGPHREALFERAKKVVPGGIYGHQTPLLLTPGSYPSFFARGQGAHIFDVDGNEYIDYMCSYGP